MKECNSAQDAQQDRISDSCEPPAESLFHFIASRTRLLLADRSAPWASIAYIMASCALFLHRSSRSMWFHGELPERFTAADGLIRAIRNVVPQDRFLFTSTRPATIEWLAAKYPSDLALPAPWNTQPVLLRFVKSLRPQMIILLESDEGTSLGAVKRAAEDHVPIVAINVGAHDGAHLGPLMPGCSWNRLVAHVCVQDQRTAAVLHARGMPDTLISVTGNLEFEWAPSTSPATHAYLRKELGLAADAPVIIAEKVTPAEEAMLVGVFGRIRSSYPNTVILLEPERHSQIRGVLDRLKHMGLTVARRSQPSGHKDPAVVLLDVPGEVPSLYGTAVCVVAGGSFAGKGALLNPVGPSLCGAPVLFGPHLSARADLVRQFVNQRAAIQVPQTMLAQTIDELIRSPDRGDAIIHNAKRLVEQHRGATEKTYRAIEALIPKSADWRPAKQEWRVRARVDRLGHTAAGKALIGVWMRGRIAGWESLRTRLGHPRTILCLGNGPSSEDPRLRGVEHDCLFRVNWRWKQRGLLVQPDLVFVGDPRTFTQVSSCVFAFEKEWETFMLVRRLTKWRFRTFDYFTVNLTPSFIDQREWYARPTNGALMIVTAVSLQPERLIISGVDLYLHPNGRYPGDLRSCNQYSQVHDRKTELQVIRRALRTYRGEVVILSDSLRESVSELNDHPGIQ